MAKSFYFDSLIMGNIMSFYGKKKVPSKLTQGVYWIQPNKNKRKVPESQTINPYASLFRPDHVSFSYGMELYKRPIVRIKIVRRMEQTIWVSRLNDGIWSYPTPKTIQVFCGKEYVALDDFKLRTIHKLDSCFTKKEWTDYKHHIERIEDLKESLCKTKRDIWMRLMQNPSNISVWQEWETHENKMEPFKN